MEDELVGYPLEAQRYLGAVDERAGEAPMSLTVSDDDDILTGSRLHGCSKRETTGYVNCSHLRSEGRRLRIYLT